MRICPALALVLALVLGCGSPPPPDAPGPRSSKQPSPGTLTVGRHQVRLVVPPGWQHFDQGSQHRLEKGQSHIHLTDLGPVTREGILREIERSRDLFRQDKLDDARESLMHVQLRGAFPSETRWSAVERPWKALLRLGPEVELDSQTIEGTYVEVLAHVDALPARDFETITVAALAELGHGAMRDVAEQRPMVVDGRDAIRVETWDRLSHTARKSHVFVLNDERLLVLWMDLGRFEQMQEAFDALVASLELPPRQGPGS